MANVEALVTEKRGRIEELVNDVNEDDTDIDQSTKEEDKIYMHVGMMTRSRQGRPNSVLSDN